MFTLKNNFGDKKFVIQILGPDWKREFESRKFSKTDSNMSEQQYSLPQETY